MRGLAEEIRGNNLQNAFSREDEDQIRIRKKNKYYNAKQVERNIESSA